MDPMKWISSHDPAVSIEVHDFTVAVKNYQKLL